MREWFSFTSEGVTKLIALEEHLRVQHQPVLFPSSWTHLDCHASLQLCVSVCSSLRIVLVSLVSQHTQLSHINVCVGPVRPKFSGVA